ncbi:MAG TPA: PQQ-binding-like beta-propeller repeat protein [Sedimentisphaerales bacterium]|nr:PQQ-binding-like beta-propeller repeat protein [Sedimentisphaerales bacterium]HQI27518.1 PQQ-binding-like beta-propeller repeat protein [Sedimentisphaerales bacterium]
MAEFRNQQNRLVLSLGFVVVWSVTGVATDWPQWRGPFFDGSTDEQGVPTSWSDTEGINWVTPLPGPSGATPVISKGRVFVTSMVKDTPQFVALCLDAADGKVLWRKDVGSDPRRFPRNTMASPSPVADGDRVFFLYGDGTLVAFDYEGRELWSRGIEKEFGNLALQFGYSNSPLLYDGKLFVTVIRRDKPYRDPPASGPLDSFLLALDPSTGKDLWKQIRKTNAFDEGMETYSTPVPFVREGRAELLLTGGDFITAHDPATGGELWRFEYWKNKVRDSRVIPSLVTGEGLIFGTRHKHEGVFAVEPPAGGDQSPKILWEFREAAPDCSTPLFYKGRLYVFDGLKRKTMTCLDPKTGRMFWQGRVPGSGPWWSSPSGADGKIFLISEAGHIVVLQAGDDEFKILFETQIKEPDIQASIVVSGGRLFIRTVRNLYCIGK